MSKFIISKRLFEQFPNLKVGVLILRSYDNSKIDESILAQMKEVQNEIKSNLQKDKLSELEEIKVWRECYSAFGAKPKKYKSSIEALLRRVLEGEDIPSVNKLVNFYNLISLKHKLPVGAEDLSKIKSDLYLTYAQGTEEFLGIGAEESKVVEKGEILYKFDNTVVCRRFNWRESDKTKIDEKTSDAIIVCESLLSSNSSLESAMSDLASHLGAEIKYLDVNNNVLDLETGELSSNDYHEFVEVSKAEQAPAKKEKSKEKSKSQKPDQSMHWADQMARKVVEIKGPKDQYVCASGITPSGVVHIGNFREIITVDLVVRAMKDAKQNVRFIYSWDDYDVFRKVPAGFPKQEELTKELRKPIVDVFDPYEEHESFARHNEVAVEQLLPQVGINPEFIYQNKQYRENTYTQGMKKALEQSAKIRDILNKHRKEPLDESWLPLGVFDPSSATDEVSEITYEGDCIVSYKDKQGERKEFDFSKDGRSKLLWRVDWPMRWEFEKVDFEPGGKDHSTQGGSYTTAKEIAKEVYGIDAPLYIMYDFIGVKGAGGKISSSVGNVITLKEVLEVYEPEIIRYLFASTRPNTEFSISFDLDVIKIYEDFDKTERIFYDAQEVSDKEKAKQKRIYELSCVEKPKEKLPYQPSFRHLTTIIQICEFDMNKVLEFYHLESDEDKKRLTIRSQCAMNWLKSYAPEEFRFTVCSEVSAELNDKEKKMLKELVSLLDSANDEQTLFNEFYTIIKNNDSSAAEFFAACYKALINKEKGPKLAPFMLQIGKQKVKDLLSQIA